MVKKFFHKKSKRVTCRHKYKIEKKVKAHHKKLKRASKNNPDKARKKKDPGVPNSLPFKEAILQEAERRKQLALELKAKLREERLNGNTHLTLEDLKRRAEAEVEDFDERIEEKKEKENIVEDVNNTSTKAYYKEFRKVIEACDVILQVLDARDPLGGRCPQVEKSILDSGPNKRLVLVLNKIDLIPKDNLNKWLTYLRMEFPTIAFKSSTQMQNQNLSQNRMSVKGKANIPKSSVCFGADLLLKLLGNYCRNKGILTSIRVGVVGFPNVGKSSLINSLKRSKACNVGATPGLTKSAQSIQLDKHIVLMDSPGVIMASGKSGDVSVALKNAVKVECIEDPIPPCQAIFQRSSKDQLMLHYKVPEFKSLEEFLASLAKKRGMLKRGGVMDINKAAKAVILDWNVGRIKYYTHPPETSTKSSVRSSKVVAQMSKEFDINALLEEEVETLKGVKGIMDVEGMVIDSTGPQDGASGGEDEEEEAMVEDEPQITVSMESKDKKGKDSDEENVKHDPYLKANTLKKKQFKKMIKKRKRSDKLATTLSETMLSSMALRSGSTSANYDFASDFK